MASENKSDDSEIKKIKEKFKLPSVYLSSEYNVWIDFSELNAQFNPVNLGQGFPNYLPPEYLFKTLSTVSETDDYSLQQYAREQGHPRLVKALSKLYSRYVNREIDPMTEILVTCGAYEALYCSILGNVDEGDEVIIIEPFFDCYEPMTQLAGGVIRYIPLRNSNEGNPNGTSADWKLDEDELRSLFNEKTKMIIVNTPLNPLGKVFSREELSFIAGLCIQYDVICVSDEVYEWLVYEPSEHVRMASLPNMYERTITIGSAGKTFCLTGWKCGWAYGPAKLISNAYVVHMANTNTYITPIQEAIARNIENELLRFDSADCWFHAVRKQLIPKREYFVQSLVKAGFKPISPEGGFFIMADWTKLATKVNLSSETNKYKDINMAKWLTKNIKLLGIPPSVFYSEEHKVIGEDHIRFCFFKTEETLDSAVACLKQLSDL